MSECMQFPDTWEEFEQWYGFEDKKEIYTNGSRLIQSFRVKQWLDHTAEPERRWIPVTEALPKEKEMVLITNNKGHVRCGQYHGTFDDKNYRWWWKHNTLEEVLAWMPLPERWRGE